MSGVFEAMLLILFVNIMLHKTSGVPTDIVNKNGVLVEEVPYGETVVLKCRSNDKDHNFQYWFLESNHLVIGPSNENYDTLKYKYEILSGNLTIRAVSKKEEGLYSCVSRGVRGEDINIEHVKVIVLQDWQEVYEHDSHINVIRLIIILITIALLAGGAFLAYKMWRDRYKYPRYLEQSEDDDDEDTEEIFRAPSTSGVKNAGNIVVDKNKSDAYESLNISTDFKSILDTANNK